MIDARVFVVALALASVAAFGSGWSWNGARWEVKLAEQEKAFHSDLDMIATAGQQARDKLQDEYDTKVAVLTDQSGKLYGEYLNGKKERDGLIDRLRSTERRLSVLISEPGGSCTSGVQDTSTGSVVHGSRRAYIDPRYGAAIIGITDRGDSEIDKLNACQAYIRTIVGKGSG